MSCLFTVSGLDNISLFISFHRNQQVKIKTVLCENREQVCLIAKGQFSRVYQLVMTVSLNIYGLNSVLFQFNIFVSLMFKLAMPQKFGQLRCSDSAARKIYQALSKGNTWDKWREMTELFECFCGVKIFQLYCVRSCNYWCERECMVDPQSCSLNMIYH